MTVTVCVFICTDALDENYPVLALLKRSLHREDIASYTNEGCYRVGKERI